MSPVCPDDYADLECRQDVCLWSGVPDEPTDMSGVRSAGLVRALALSRNRPRIALDVQFSKQDVWMLKELGFDVVCVAAKGEPDIAWMERAVEQGVEMSCSPDSDVEIYAYDHRIGFCKVPGSHSVYKPQLVASAWLAFKRGQL